MVGGDAVGAAGSVELGVYSSFGVWRCEEGSVVCDLAVLWGGPSCGDDSDGAVVGWSEV